MNPILSTTLSIADPSRAPTDILGASSAQSSGDGASDSFNALYLSEAASFDGENLNKNININELDENDVLDNTDSQLSPEENEEALVVDEFISKGNKDEIPAPLAHDLASQDQTFETELLHGISVALPSNSPQTKIGEKLPPGGKELPYNSAPSEQELPLTRQTGEPALQDVVARVDAGIQIQRRDDMGERGDHPRQKKVADLTSTHPGFPVSERGLEMTQSKILSEPLTENPSLPPFKPLQEAPLTVSNNPPTNLATVISQTDSTAAQKLSLAADAAANTDLNANARGSSFDRSNVLGEKIHWMHNAKISTAELHLHPAELGSIEIKIVTEDQQARVSFITSSATARDVIEESLPKLRELLADSGLALDQSDISQKESGDESTRKDRQALPENIHIEREIERKFTASPVSTRIGQVDHYV